MVLFDKPRWKEFIKYFFSPTKYTPMILWWSEKAKHHIIVGYFIAFLVISLLLVIIPLDDTHLRVADFFHDSLDIILIAWMFLNLKKADWQKKKEQWKPIFLDILFLLVLNRIYVFIFAFSDGIFLREELNMLLLFVVAFYLFYVTSKSLSILLEYPFWRVFILLFALFSSLNKLFELLPY